MSPEKGYIYIVTNPMMTGYIKIGYAKDINDRLKTFNTGSIKDYECYASYEVYSYQVDKQVHGIIELLNPRLRVPNKEFFRMEPGEAYELLEHIAKITNTEDRLCLWTNGRPIKTCSIQEVLPEAEELPKEYVVKEPQQRRPKVDMFACGLKPGDVLTCKLDGKTTATVYDEHNIMFEGKPTGLAAAATKVYINIHGQKCCNGQPGADSWIFEGETLQQRRNRLGV